VLDAKGQGRTSDVIRAIEFATANKDALRIRVINISLGHPIYEPAGTDPLVQAVEAAVRAGLVVVTASGNFGINPATGEPGYAGVVSPGNAPSALTVGALATFGTSSRADDRIAPYSSRGPSWYDGFAKPDIAAPGHNMLSVAARKSALRKMNEQRGGSGDYMRLSGTSMAAGVASGVVSLMLQTNPLLTPNALKMALQFTSIPLMKADGTVYDRLSQGTGSINAAGALQVAVSIDATQPVGAKWLAFGLPMQSTLCGRTYAWSQSMLWGAHLVLGDGIIDENRPAWATSVIWGDGTSDDNIVWGTQWGDDDNIVWGTLFDDGDNIVWGTNFLWSDDDNIVWGTAFDDDNIVWGTNVVWGTALLGFDDGDNIVWGTFSGDDDNIVWGTLFDEDNIVWGTLRGDGEDGDNIVWGTSVIWGDRVIRAVGIPSRGVRR
jgi:serine protease AprX